MLNFLNEHSSHGNKKEWHLMAALGLYYNNTGARTL
jgi:hypothetical protein